MPKVKRNKIIENLLNMSPDSCNEGESTLITKYIKRRLAAPTYFNIFTKLSLCFMNNKMGVKEEMFT